MKTAQLAQGEAGRVAHLCEVDDALVGARRFIQQNIPDPELQQLLLKAVRGLESQLEAEQAFLPFVHFPLVIYSALRGDSAPARPLAVATTLLFLGIDILDDIADGDLPGHWQNVSEGEIQLVAATLLSSLPQLVISQLTVAPAVKVRMVTLLSEGLMHMGGGQLHDMRGAGRAEIRPEDVEASVAHKSGEEGALMAMLSATMAGASEEVVQKYGAFGRWISTGGQLATDCFDLFQADESKDLANGSRTLPIAIHLSRLQGADRAAFLAQLDEARASVATRSLIQRELRANGILRLCALIVEIYCQKARDVLEGLEVPVESRHQMERMIAHVSFFSKEDDSRSDSGGLRARISKL